MNTLRILLMAFATYAAVFSVAGCQRARLGAEMTRDQGMALSNEQEQEWIEALRSFSIGRHTGCLVPGGSSMPPIDIRLRSWTRAQAEIAAVLSSDDEYTVFGSGDPNEFGNVHIVFFSPRGKDGLKSEQRQILNALFELHPSEVAEKILRTVVANGQTPGKLRDAAAQCRGAIHRAARARRSAFPLPPGRTADDHSSPATSALTLFRVFEFMMDA